MNKKLCYLFKFQLTIPKQSINYIVGLPRSVESILSVLGGDTERNVPLAMFFKVLDLVVNRRLYHDTDISIDNIWDV